MHHLHYIGSKVFVILSFIFHVYCNVNYENYSLPVSLWIFCLWRQTNDFFLSFISSYLYNLSLTSPRTTRLFRCQWQLNFYWKQFWGIVKRKERFFQIPVHSIGLSVPVIGPSHTPHDRLTNSNIFLFLQIFLFPMNNISAWFFLYLFGFQLPLEIWLIKCHTDVTTGNEQVKKILFSFTRKIEATMQSHQKS